GFVFLSSRRRHTRSKRDWSSDVCSSDLVRKQTITLGGAFSKRLMGGPVAPAEITISTAAMKRVLAYEPRDLTISVEAGMRYAERSEERRVGKECRGRWGR